MDSKRLTESDLIKKVRNMAQNPPALNRDSTSYDIGYTVAMQDVANLVNHYDPQG